MSIYSFGSAANLALRIDDFFSNSKSQIKSVDGNIGEYRNLAVFATYSGRPLDKFDIQALGSLRSLGFGICIVANQNTYDPLDYSKYADVVILRRNVGLDLAAMRDALKLLGKDWDRLILLNDSVVWPKKNFQNVVSTVLSFEAHDEILVLVDSFQRGHHFQSFFLAANKTTIAGLHETFMQIKNWRFKRSVINFGEIPMKTKLEFQGIRVQPLIPYKKLEHTFTKSLSGDADGVEIARLMARNVPLNPSQHFWKVLLKNEYGCIKRSLIVQNPAKLQFPPTYADVSETQ